MRSTLPSLCLLLVCLLPHTATAAPRSIVQWSVKSSPVKALRPGEKFDVVVMGKIDPGWHLYALEEPEGGPVATVIGLTEGDPADLLHVDEDTPIMVNDPLFQQEAGLFQNVAHFTLHLRLAAHVAPGPHALRVLIRFQSCDDHVCLAPHTDTVPVPLHSQH